MHPQSPALRNLAAAVRNNTPGATDIFWRHAATSGTPLVEPDPTDPGNPAYRLVTFLWRDDPAAPATDVLALLHTVTDKDRHARDLSPHLMEKVPGTDVWAISHRLRADHRAAYQFFVARGPREETLRTDREAWLRVLDAAVPDPLATVPVLPSKDGRNPSSVLELPDAPAQKWALPRAEVARGRRVEAEVDGRKVSVHLPAGHRAGDGSYAVAVLLDGEMWGPVLGFGDTLDNLHAERRIEPTVTLQVHTMGRARRMADLSCSEEFVDWLADVLLPWAADAYGATGDPARTVVAGQSAGGLTAAFAAFRRPERFGNALSQSGSFWWPDDTEFDGGSEWLTRQYAVREKQPVRFHLEVGLQEWMLLPQNRHLRNVLEARGYEVTYREFNGGHDYACWRGGLADGLAGLLGPR
ncbi:enterochelin esterase [Streptomyces albireticuli]|uniref:Enterochelin esterase n=1 Tax=Streptomyces albireticuli TaxID=1940 RepID=A0A2A2DDZ1_9ACTN|nr:enterochelin esterase [Streptomyces albireticuli]MCD9141042.1 enterochelin esterase [Streptomyces albireticuli]MCD9160996.1 enterochelin esterase [Streptomyces albireticuli]MCD9190946.1 enterochelin esterase [Streptomyces albireticuli]PAU49609.1 enterochelin esterase [Streptomyces albireticuli]